MTRQVWSESGVRGWSVICKCPSAAPEEILGSGPGEETTSVLLDRRQTGRYIDSLWPREAKRVMGRLVSLLASRDEQYLQHNGKTSLAWRKSVSVHNNISLDLVVALIALQPWSQMYILKQHWQWIIFPKRTFITKDDMTTPSSLTPGIPANEPRDVITKGCWLMTACL